MKVRDLRSDLVRYLSRHKLNKKFSKQKETFSENPHHPSLHTEILEPKNLKIYSFRIDKKYRVVFIIIFPGEVEIIDINDHYQ